MADETKKKPAPKKEGKPEGAAAEKPAKAADETKAKKAPAAAGAQRTLRIDRHVPKFARHIVVAARELAVHVDADANAFGHRHHNQVFDVFEMIEPCRREHAGVRRIFELDLYSQRTHAPKR